MAYSDSSIDLETVLYVSAAAQEMTPVGLYGLLTKARECNHNTQITGVLLYGEGMFIQVLEGPGEKLDAALKRIKADSRHSGMKVIHRAPIVERSFPDWRMGYQKVDDACDGVFALTREALTDESNDAGEEVMTLLREYYALFYPHAVR